MVFQGPQSMSTRVSEHSVASDPVRRVSKNLSSLSASRRWLFGCASVGTLKSWAWDGSLGARF